MQWATVQQMNNVKHDTGDEKRNDKDTVVPNKKIAA